MISWPCDPPREELDGSDEEPCGCRGDGLREVLAEATGSVEPCESALDDPAAGQEFEAFCPIGTLDDFERPLANTAQRILELVARVIAPRPAGFRGFDALAVDHARAGRSLAATPPSGSDR